MNNVVANGTWLMNHTSVDNTMTVAEALEQSGADFNVQKQEMYYLTPELRDMLMRNVDIPSTELIAQLKKVEGKQANVRMDNLACLGVTSDNYGIVQNKEAFDFVDLLCTGDHNNTPIIDAAGTLNDGKRVFIVARFPQEIVVNNNDNDRVQMQVVVSNSHDGSSAVKVCITPVRVVCQNMLNIAFKKASGTLFFKHTSNVNKRLDLLNKENAKFVFQTLGMADVYQKEFKASLDRLADIKMSHKEMEEALVKSLLSNDIFTLYKKNNNSMECDEISTRSKNIIANVFDACESGIGQEKLVGGNGLWLVNGLTTYYQNYAKFADNDKKMSSILDGNVQQKVQNLYDNVVALAA